MSEHINLEKLANVLNSTSQQGKGHFVRMLWNNQPSDIQTELMPLLNDEALQTINTPPEEPVP